MVISDQMRTLEWTQMQENSTRRVLVVTAGNLRQSHIYIRGHIDFFPPECVGPSRKARCGPGKSIEIALDGLAEVISTDLSADRQTGKPRGFFRGLRWVRKFFKHHNVGVGDLLTLERLAATSYRLSVEKRASNKIPAKPTCAGRNPTPDSVSINDDAENLGALFSTRFSGPAWPDRFGKWITEWSKNKLVAPIRTFSLFTGAGGLDIGFHQAGFHAAVMVEVDERFVATLGANCGLFGLFGNAAPRAVDVRKYKPSEIGTVDFIIGGPPCQSFSAAGRRAGGVQGTTDERGQLFLAYVDLLKGLKPRGFLFENVYGITGTNAGRDWGEIREAFSSAGYSVSYRVLDTADYGVPQHRERMFIVGLRDGSFRFPRPTHGPDSPNRLPYYAAGTAVDGAPQQQQEEPVTVNGRYGKLLTEIPPGLNYSFFTERMRHPRPLFAWRSKFSDFLYKADPARPVRTIKAQGGQYMGPFHWDNRPFSTSELKRLQTFPDDYQIIGGRAAVIHQIGNSVPPQVARIRAVANSYRAWHGRLHGLQELTRRRQECVLRSSRTAP
jgi:site-specific DNA-cytosine methylase